MLKLFGIFSVVSFLLSYDAKNIYIQWHSEYQSYSW